MKPLLQSRLVKILKALTKKESIFLIIAALIFFGSAVTYGVSFVKANTYKVPVHGGTYREGIVGQPSFINPAIPTTETDRVLSSLIFANLYDMAETIKRSEDGKTWNVRLKEGITWHDEEKVTSDDIIFTVDIIQNPESRSPLGSSFEGVSTQRVSELEVKFTLQNPYAFFEEEHIKNLRPIPKHIFEDIPVTNLKVTPFGLNPVGSGPYEIVGHEKDRKGLITDLKLRSFDEYFEKEAYIKNLDFKFFKEEGDLISSYNLGQIDGFGLTNAEPITERSIIIRNTPHYLNSSRYYAVFLNPSLVPESIQNIETRRILFGSVNRETLVEDVLGGNGSEYYGPTPLSEDPGFEYSASSLSGLSFEMVVPDQSFLVKTAKQIEKDWELLGADVTLKISSLRDIQEDILRNTNYQMILFGNIVKESNDLFAFWHSSKRFFPDQNLALYQSDRVDSLLEQYRQTFDREEQIETLEAISDQLEKDIPAIFLYSPHYVYVSIPSLGGFDDLRTINTSEDRFENITEWFVKSRRSFTNPHEEGEQLQSN